MKCHAEDCTEQGVHQFGEYFYCEPHWHEIRDLCLASLNQLLDVVKSTLCPKCSHLLPDCGCNKPQDPGSLPN